jgi:integrase
MTETPNATSTETPTRRKRDRGAGCLMPPRPGVTRFWSVQIRDVNGRQVRKSRLRSGGKVSGELKPGCDPKLVESWTGITQARILLQQVIEDVTGGTVTVGHDPARTCYADLRELYLTDAARKQNKSLLHKAEDGDPFVCGLNHLDEFFGYEKEGDKGVRVVAMENRIDQFIMARKEAGAKSGTINRALGILRRMFTLGVRKHLIKTKPFIEMLPEPKQPRQGFLSITDYQKLYDAFGVSVTNQATGKTSQPFDYIQPLLQVAYFTGMRWSEIVNLRWANVDAAENFIHLFADETKGEEARDIPMLDGLPQLFESLRNAQPAADENALVFVRNGEPIGSIRKAWGKLCIQTAMSTMLRGISTVSHFSRGPECCAACRRLSQPDDPSMPVNPIVVGTYVGLVFHDLRRSFVSNMVEAGISKSDTMEISGHRTKSTFERYNIADNKPRKRENAAKVMSYLDEKKREQAAATSPSKLRTVKSA